MIVLRVYNTNSINKKWGFLFKICNIIETISLTHSYYPFQIKSPSFILCRRHQEYESLFLRANTSELGPFSPSSLFFISGNPRKIARFCSCGE
jgi:hypothetical protein